MAQANRCTVEALCAIGDEHVAFKFHRAGVETVTHEVAYSEVVAMTRDYINEIGGFEKLAEWGLV
jgi:S-adenosylmethionine synthetase